MSRAAQQFTPKDLAEIENAATGKVGFDVDEATGLPFVIDDAGNVVFTILSAETVRDVVGALVVDSATIDAVYDDGADTLTLSVKPTSITEGMLAFSIATQAELDAISTALSDHINDATDAHDASAISYNGSAGLSAVNVEAALDELDSEKQPIDATLTALAGQNWADDSMPIGTGADTMTQLAIAANRIPGRASGDANITAKTATDAAFAFLAAIDAAAETALLATATTALKGLQSAADKLKENNMWVDVVAEFGADPTDGGTLTGAQNLTAIQAAIDSFTSAGGILFFPKGTYQINGTLTIDVPITILGQGRANTNIKTTHATSDVFNIVTGAQGCGFEQIRISATNSTTRTGGYGVDMNDLADVTMFKCDILYMHTGIHMGGALQNIEDINIRECGLGATNGQNILVDGFGDRRISKVVIDNGSDPTGHAGIRVRRCSSLLISDCNIVNSTNCLDIVPNGGGGQEAASVYAINCFFDSSTIGLNIVPASNSDTAQRMMFVRCWFGTHTQAGVVLGGAAINVANTTKVDFTACEFYQSPFGIDCLGIAEWSVRSSRFSGNTTNAIRIVQGLQAGVQNFSITDNFIGNAGSFGANAQGISIGAGTYGRYQVIDNRGLDTNTTPGMIDAGTATNGQKNVFNNMGYNSIATNIGADVSFTTSEILLLQCRIPAGTRNVGDTWRVRICGTGPIAAGNVTLRLKIDANDGTTAGTVLLTLPAITGVVNGRWGLDAQVVMKTATSVRGEGYGYSNTAIIHPTAAAPPAATAVTTTAPFFIKVTGQMSASTSIATTGSITPLG